MATETVDGTTVALEGIDDVHGGNSLAMGVLSVGGSVAKDLLEELAKGSTALGVNLSRDALHTTTTGEAAKSRLGDSSDGLLERLTVTLSSSLSETLTSFSAARHGVRLT
ncbi:MAG: hypothetical protein WC763_05835 [Candidatus Paceibacterota bacterium]|jgi:hypothetical protein